MRLPMMARARVSMLTMLAATGVLLAACAGETTAPKASPSESQLSRSPFAPTAAQKSLVGVTDGVYTFTIDPTQDQSLALGPNHLDLPANSVCDLATTSYGVQYWNDPCSPQTAPLTITAVVKNANTSSPSIDFFPAMRFNPKTPVNLYIYVPTGLSNFAKQWTVQYCGAFNRCYDESQYDRDLRTLVDAGNSVVFRRIKHFSGYVVAEFASDSFSGGW
jgi:hypothetical protein